MRGRHRALTEWDAVGGQRGLCVGGILKVFARDEVSIFCELSVQTIIALLTLGLKNLFCDTNESVDHVNVCLGHAVD